MRDSHVDPDREKSEPPAPPHHGGKTALRRGMIKPASETPPSQPSPQQDDPEIVSFPEDLLFGEASAEDPR